MREFFLKLNLFLIAFFVFALGAYSKSAYVYNSEGIKYMENKDYRNAVKSFEEAYSQDSDNEVIKQNLVYAYAALANEYAGKENWDKAVEYGKSALKFSSSKDRSLLKSNISSYYSNYGNQQYQDNYPDRALYYFRRSLEYDKNNYAAFIGMGKINYDRGKLDEALSNWEKAVAINPGLDEIKGKIENLKKENEMGKDFSKKSLWYFDVRYEGRKNEELASIAVKILNRAYNDIGNDLKFYPKDKTTVIIYNKEQFQEATGRPDWIAGVYDGIIRIHAQDIKNSKVIENILYHEYTHSLLYKKVGPSLPIWLNEGLAQAEEPQGRKLTREEFKILKESLDEGRYLTFEEMNKAFGANRDKDLVKQAYAQSKSIVAYMIERHHMFRINLILDNLKNGIDIDQALKKTLYVDSGDLLMAWEKWFKKENKTKSRVIISHD
ncbi:MAG: hypothetical protein JW867_07075 [Candidatus Omnitrophica bacterium]|nr:hypothetical protein [Candidatus Omnitrophota bacterium]